MYMDIDSSRVCVDLLIYQQYSNATSTNYRVLVIYIKFLSKQKLLHAALGSRSAMAI